ncbi:acyl-CoA thioesterase/bile acid-CoA:amino acid N-acyltransferase family protein [Kibdelosporangium persicum]|uniref:Acyl-CoA thioester hydrolase/BAAT N-terminal region n=1 Tax=Kibdelosporangium persicum TaxID=2698649 RepID=A0ABX2FHH5_9PSEU|nr:acyl-CoA thioesterase/bile acid-CoA:amino acid N-acyltransferase family protein [Kibdelosporangium persicum]NRN70856.1 Acyl-CoA thioester hydrolase/BAAT N-terminal region [Kibdelosporangium persicum]
MPDDHAPHSPTPARILVEPADPLVDTPLDIRLAGFAPADEVVVRCQMIDPRGRRWESAVTVHTGEDGGLDLAAATPAAGTYDEPDAMGLVWSMKAKGKPDKSLRDRRILPPAQISLTAEKDGQLLARATVDRLRLPVDVQRVPVRSDGLVGTLFWPREGGPYPGVLLLGGSEGGLHELDAALLAARGYAVLALAYFGMRGVPSDLVSIPLEYFGKAMSFLRGRRKVQGDRLGVIGGSRGGEAALLLAATYPDIAVAVSLVGAGVITQGISRKRRLLDTLHEQVPAWTYRGKALPFLPNQVPAELTEQVAAKVPVELGLAFTPSLADRDAVTAAAIPVEQIRGAVLAITAGDDRMWPCTELSELAIQRLAAAGHNAAKHVHYPDAGHLIAAPPYGPTTEILTPGPGVRFRTGGSAKANAAARVGAWHALTEFLEEHLAS